jgi:hypothetical protein
MSNNPKLGRPSLYSQELVDSICSQVGDGMSLRKVCEHSDMPDMTTVFKWLRENEDFSHHYARAKEASADSHADRIGDLSERILAGEYDPQAARVAIDALKWTASKLKPKKYGDRIHTEHSGAVGLSDMSQDELDRKLAELKQLSESE